MHHDTHSTQPGSDQAGMMVSKPAATCSSPRGMTPDRQKHRSDKEHPPESSSFVLFNESFDSMSQTGRELSPVNAHDPFALSGPVLSPSLPRTRTPVDINLPKLKHGCDDSSDCSIGNISPIKVAFSNRTTTAMNQSSTVPSSIRRPDMHSAEAQPHYVSHGQQDIDYWQQDHQRQGTQNDHSNSSNPFFVIRSARRVLQVCKFPLPCLQGMDLCRVNMSSLGHIHHYRGAEDAGGLPTDIAIGTRRVEAAICAFGGSLQTEQNPNILSCFRVNRDSSRDRQQYEKELPKRYALSHSHVTWEVEEEPPIYVGQHNNSTHSSSNQNIAAAKNPPTPSRGEKDAFYGTMTTTAAGGFSSTPERDLSHGGGGGGGTGTTREGSSLESSPSGTAANHHINHQDDSKGKYRCKLCGQPKQNHECPYRPSLQRSIGVMVYPAVNSFTAAEPGTIAPPLDKMNNFVSYDSDQGSSNGHGRTREPSAPTLLHSDHHHHPASSASHQPHDAFGQHRHHHHRRDPSTVTPDGLRTIGSTSLHSPQSALSTQSDELSPHGVQVATASGDARYMNNHHKHGMMATSSTPGILTSATTHAVAVAGQKRSHSQAMPLHHDHHHHGSGQGSTTVGSSSPPQGGRSYPFVASLTLRPEHYRAVTTLQNVVSTTPTTAAAAYTYPCIPLTFFERRRLSDTLFCLAQGIPGMTTDCAIVLRHARACNGWDQAVAELLTQVIVGMYCAEGDVRLNGLRRYLLALGISC